MAPKPDTHALTHLLHKGPGSGGKKKKGLDRRWGGRPWGPGENKARGAGRRRHGMPPVPELRPLPRVLGARHYGAS